MSVATASDGAPFAQQAELGSNSDNAIPLREVISMAEKVTAALKPLVRSLDKAMYRELKDMLDSIEALRGDLSKVDPDDIFSRRIPEMGRELKRHCVGNRGGHQLDHEHCRTGFEPPTSRTRQHMAPLLSST